MKRIQPVFFKDEQHEEYRLLSQMFHLCHEAIFYCFYKSYFDSVHSDILRNASVRDWFICTVNSYYDNAVRNWCMMFGSRSENTHYYKLLNYKGIETKLTSILSKTVTKEVLKEKILDAAKMTENEYSQFHKKTKDYRDRYLIHREYSPQKVNEGDIHNPQLKPIKNTLIFLCGLIIQVLNEYKRENGGSGKFELLYVDIYSAKDIEEVYNKSISSLEKDFSLIAKLNTFAKPS